MNLRIRKLPACPARLAPLLLVASALLLPVAAAHASVPIESFRMEPSTTQAGGHPDIHTVATFGNHTTVDEAGGCDCSDAKDLIFNVPAGVIGDPHATPQCNQAEFAAADCPVDSQVGLDIVHIEAGSPFLVPVFNLEPTPGNAGLLGFTIGGLGLPIYQILNPRTESDYGLKDSILGIPIHHFAPLLEVNQKLWGVPAASVNDPLRFPHGGTICISLGAGRTAEEMVNAADLTELNCSGLKEEFGYSGPIPSNSPTQPFLDNPTSCGEVLTSTFELTSYDEGLTNAQTPWPATTGCEQLSFNPSLFAQPTTTETDSPSGLAVDLQVPQDVSPTVPSPSEIRAATVTLPEGFSINPNAADGKTSCTGAEARFGTEEEAQCPDFSKIGTLSIESSALPGPLPGYLYLGEPQPGNRYRVFLIANGFGVHVKLPGSVHPDPVTGRLVISFQNLPQTPLTDFNLHIFGSERGLLATPTHCGTYAVESRFVPWDSALPEQTSTQFFELTSGPEGAPCPLAKLPFAPSLNAGVADSTAGAHSPFTLQLSRPDGDQSLTGLTATTPPGFAATLAGIPYCPESAIASLAGPLYTGLAELASPACPAASQIGTAVAGAGAGPHPLYLPGKVYLTGPYKGAPLSLLVVIPAVSGPYDLGNVAVRAALHVDPITAQVTTVSDPLPQIVGGIPIRTRQILVNLDRPGFALNPTSCHPFSVNATISGDEGAQANLSSHFQVANCASLAFKPKLALKVSGGVKRSANPALRATVSYPTPAPYANIASTAVTLPHSEFLDNAHIRNPCTRVVFTEGSTPGERCPVGSVIGFAKAETPLLDKPLEGPVYLRSSSHKLPDIVAALKGQIDIELDGRVDSVHERLRTTFENVPDAPVSKFTLSLDGGNKGLLENSENLCHAPQVASVKMAGQNGKNANANVTIQTPCGGTQARGEKHRSKSRANPNLRAGR